MNRTWSAFVGSASILLFYLEHGWNAYFEDRWPAPNADPHQKAVA